ncbi:uridine kinase family protein [Psychroserpens luteolus]|uniref:uridine kinase family protein n=1 Tax=Psychroserpens luteolus TaxID=2855840 RepID=UPI001E55BDDA|nr:hypothetical protein [Psychroserpens luteolus]MCD2260574.1 hypothetical protein [Psychroserpens luteolus]
MTIEHTLSREIISRKKNLNTTIVAICGAADLGKSHIAQNIIRHLEHYNQSANHLTLDSYLMPREDRLKKNLSGYQIEAYNIDLALKNLITIKNKESITFHPYHHRKGENANNTITLTNSDILIFDGLHVMHPTFLPYIDMSIFISTNDDVLKQIRRDADLIKRNYTLNFSEQISDSEFNLYKSNIEPYNKLANYKIFLESKWHYKLI